MTTKPQNDTAVTYRLKDLYFNEYRPQLKDELKLRNINQTPKIEKIIINIGLGRSKDDKRTIEVASNTLRKITGQQSIDTIAKKSIAGFKLREGNKIGIKVTLRDIRMYEFIDRLINLVIPRFRDFHGFNVKSFDGSGNFSIGVPDQSVFPELSFEETSLVHGLQINFVIKSNSKEQSKALLEKLGILFEKNQENKTLNSSEEKE